jgi:hypothetical protein
METWNIGKMEIWINGNMEKWNNGKIGMMGLFDKRVAPSSVFLFIL